MIGEGYPAAKDWWWSGDDDRWWWPKDKDDQDQGCTYSSREVKHPGHVIDFFRPVFAADRVMSVLTPCWCSHWPPVLSCALRAPLQAIFLLESHSCWLTSPPLSLCPRVTDPNSISQVGESDLPRAMFKLKSWPLGKSARVLFNVSGTSLPCFCFAIVCGREPESSYRNGWGLCSAAHQSLAHCPV